MHRPGPGWRGACHKQLCSTAAARFLVQQLGPGAGTGPPSQEGTLISDLAPYFLFSRNIIWLSHYDIRGGRRVGAVQFDGIKSGREGVFPRLIDGCAARLCGVMYILTAASS